MMHSKTEVADVAWSSGRLLPAFQAPEHLDVYDIRNVSHDVQLSVTTMTGIINRQQPKVYLLANDDAAFWLNEVFAQIPRDVSSAQGEEVLNAILNSYGSYVRGLIIYDPNCMDSINVATMLAGQRDSIVISPALAESLQGQPYRLPVVADLRIYQWKNRVQAYSWAERNLLENASPNLVAGLDPRIPGALRSFLVATRAFVYWLDARKFLPCIQNGCISERRLMQRILKAFPPGTIHLGWFINEGQGVRLTSKAAIPMLASDHFFNLEVWTSIQDVQDVQGGEKGQVETVDLVETVDQGGTANQMGASDLAGASPATTFPFQGSNTALNVVAGLAPARSTVPARSATSARSPKAYVSFTISDGDNLQYDQHRMARLWQDPARGSIPIGWTISPALVQAAPALAAYYRRMATPNDELVAGPSGAGYVLPSCWPTKHLPAFLRLTGKLMQAMNLGVIEVLDTGLWPSMAFINPELQQDYVEALADLGVRGILSGSGQTRASWRNVSGVPVLQNLGLANRVDKTVRLVRNASERFLNVYVFAWSMTPSDLKQVVLRLGDEYEVITPGRLLAMIAEASN